jgi:hypothetical protein
VDHSTQIHDFNSDFGDPVNAQGDRTFWIAAIPDSDVQVTDLLAGKAEMHVDNLAVKDYFDIPNALAVGPAADALGSFDVVWDGPVTRSVKVSDAANGFKGNFFENQPTVTWSGMNELGFQFFGDPGDFSTSVPERAFSEIGREWNGIFFGNPLGADATSQDPVQQALTTQQLQPVLQEAIASGQAAGTSAAQVAALNQVQVPIAALPGSRLGEEAGQGIWISPNAARGGWFVDASPARNGDFPATPGSPAYGKMDLLSPVDHELGHVLGLEPSQDSNGVVGDTYLFAG